MWLRTDPERQAAIPPLMLTAAEVEDGRVSTWVVDASLRPLLDLCVVRDKAYVTIGG